MKTIIRTGTGICLVLVALHACGRECLSQHFPELHRQTESRQYRLIVVPAIDYDQAPQPEERIAEFRSVLEESFVEAKQLAENCHRAGDLLSGNEPRDQDYDSRAVINACSTCRGWCCRSGYRHAYLLPEFLAWRLTKEPDVSSEDMIDDYIDRIPSESQNGSCVYHTTSGCALPREVRSSTCNDFLCPGLRQYKLSIDEDPDQATAVVACDDNQYVRLGVMDSEGNRTEYPITCTIRPPAQETCCRWLRII